MKKYSVAIVGATGAVGLEMLRTLEERHFPVRELRLYASDRSRGKSLLFEGRPISIESLSSGTWKRIDFALFSAGASVSKEFAPRFSENGTFVIDNSSAWRMDPEVPLLVPEVNPQSLQPGSRIIANPNCSTIQMVVALKPLHDAAGLRRVIVATYQAASGAGGLAIEDLQAQLKAWASDQPIPKSKKLPAQIAFNVIPQIDTFTENSYTKEEMKMLNETRKIMGIPDLAVSATCVRVPVFRGHSEAVWAEFKRPISARIARDILSKAHGVKLIDGTTGPASYPMPFHSEGKYDVFVGRVREDISVNNGLAMWIVSDNLLKGAASNAVQIAEIIHERGFVKT